MPEIEGIEQRTKKNVYAKFLLNTLRSYQDMCRLDPKTANYFRTTFKHNLNPINWDGQQNYVSKKAKEFASKKKFPKDLRTVSWLDLGDKKIQGENIEKGNGKRGLKYEHVIPTSVLFNKISKIKTPDITNVISIMDEVRVAVITREENENLDKKYKTNGRNNLEDALKVYKELGIIIECGITEEKKEGKNESDKNRNV